MEPDATTAGNSQSQVPEGAYSARSGPISDEAMAMENLEADERMLEEAYRLEHESAAKTREDQTPANLSPYADEAYREGD